ncbi:MULTISPECIES: SDR family NAD(P)-dependent oxidoreductase [Propionimicrobium]|uniref:SDR family NAD(P)-dependent oxidoreductase n=1 Tax=Propionimicrobium TaxID=203133 RepID=UPI0003A0D3A7|nr:oxidoreductase, short chain dehydrogenase/reductase domain protein [Propionimicrobium sp. BV2F7]
MKLFVVVDQEGSARRNNRIVEKRAVVTGASSGIGVATARALAKAGFKVFCAARLPQGNEARRGEVA